MKTKILNWKKIATVKNALMAATAFVLLVGCSSDPTPYHNHKFVVSDAERAQSNNYPPAPAKQDSFMTYYKGYSEDRSRNTRMGEGTVGTAEGNFTPQQPQGFTGGGYYPSYYGNYHPWGSYNAW